ASTWSRHSWYLRLPGPSGAPWAGVVRCECSPDLAPADAIALADTTAAVLPRFASEPHKDTRAPPNPSGPREAFPRGPGDPRLPRGRRRTRGAACALAGPDGGDGPIQQSGASGLLASRASGPGAPPRADGLGTGLRLRPCGADPGCRERPLPPSLPLAHAHP